MFDESSLGKPRTQVFAAFHRYVLKELCTGATRVDLNIEFAITGICHSYHTQHSL